MGKWVRKFMTGELGWSKPNERELSDVANELEKSVATDKAPIHLKKILRKEWTVKVTWEKTFPFCSSLQNDWDLYSPFSSSCHPSSLVLTQTLLFNLLLFDYGLLVSPLWKYDQHAWKCVVQALSYNLSLILATDTTVNPQHSSASFLLGKNILKLWD